MKVLSIQSCRALIFPLLVAFGFTAACNAEDIPKKDGPLSALSTDDVHAFMARWIEAETSESFDNIEPLFYANAIYRSSDADYHGIDAIRASFEGTWSGAEDQTYQMTDIKIEYLGKEFVTIAYSWVGTGIGQAGPFRITGRGTKVLTRIDGELKVILLHLNQDSASAGPKLRSAENRQALIDGQIDPSSAKFQAIKGTYEAPDGPTLEFLVNDGKMSMHVLETGFSGQVVPISPNHFVLLDVYDISYRFFPDGSQTHAMESQSGPAMRFYSRRQ